MKILCSIFLLILLVDESFSQGTTAGVVSIGKIPSEGILLDKGWKFQVGDNADYSKPGFNDEDWQPINPTLDIHDLPQIPKSGIVWFRLHLFVDTNLLKEQLALVIQQSGASQIYLNGSLIINIGVFDTDPAKVKAYDPLRWPVALPVKSAGQQILTIRYALQSGVKYTAIFESHNYAFFASINTLEAANRNLQRISFFYSARDFSILGIYFILIILHLSFFLFYRSQKANLYFCLYALLMMASEIWRYSYGYSHWIEHKFYMFNLAMGLFCIGALFMVTAIYYLFEQKRGIWYFTLVIVGVLSIVALALPGYWGWKVGAVLLSNLLNLEITRISFIAVKKKKRGAWIMVTGCLCYLVSYGAFWGIGHPGQFELFTFITFCAAFLSIPVSTSVYLGLDFAFTNRALQQKLTEVKKLSDDNLKKETEKNALALQMAALETKALRAQMNPHFVFNALNAIKKFLLKNDTANADKYLGSFAKLQRLVLDNTRDSKVVLENEIKLLELYLRLEHLRFEDRLTYSIHIDEKINLTETEIPSMLIQPFVENAIAHGLQHKVGKGGINISFCQEDGWIKVVIEDDGIGRVQAASFQKNEVSPHKSLATKISEERLSVLGRNKNLPSGIEIIDLYDEQKKPCGTKVIICIPAE